MAVLQLILYLRIRGGGDVGRDTGSPLVVDLGGGRKQIEDGRLGWGEFLGLGGTHTSFSG